MVETHIRELNDSSREELNAVGSLGALSVLEQAEEVRKDPVHLHLIDPRLRASALALAVSRGTMHCLVLERVLAHEIIGYAQFEHRIDRHGRTYAHVHGIYVLPQHRKVGWARRLVAEILKQAEERGSRYVVGTAHAANIPARRLLNAAGFDVIGETQRTWHAFVLAKMFDADASDEDDFYDLGTTLMEPEPD